MLVSDAVLLQAAVLKTVYNTSLYSGLRRNQVKAEYLMSIESSESLLEEIGAQALATAAYQLPDTVVQAIDAVTHDDVVKVGAFIVEVVVLYVSVKFLLHLRFNGAWQYIIISNNIHLKGSLMMKP